MVGFLKRRGNKIKRNVGKEQRQLLVNRLYRFYLIHR